MLASCLPQSAMPKSTLRLLHKTTFTNGHIVVHKQHMLADILEGLPGRPLDIFTFWLPMATSSMHTTSGQWPRSPRSALARLSTWLRPRWIMEKGFGNFAENLDITMNCIGTGSKPRPLVAKPKKELIGNDKVKVDCIKDANKLQAELDRDHSFQFHAVPQVSF